MIYRNKDNAEVIAGKVEQKKGLNRTCFFFTVLSIEENTFPLSVVSVLETAHWISSSMTVLILCLSLRTI